LYLGDGGVGGCDGPCLDEAGVDPLDERPAASRHLRHLSNRKQDGDA